PVAVGPKRAPTRVVAFGGSSTGGGWQFDDLSVFYPARLDALLGPEVEVVNQGVGGWTSFHVARYAEQRLADLDPDIVTLYAGNNDSAAGYPATIAELHARWSRSARAGPVRRLLERSAIARWLAQLRAAPAPDGGVPAVRPDEMADNLASLLAACRAEHASLVLIAEANVDDNPRLSPYREVMVAMAEAEPDAWFLDGHALLSGRPEYFLDTVHLTEAGHARLAQALADFLLDHHLLAERR
ncbi:MAG: SGNH/GDSL hydrolase family protein, partial [Deltaproteobacteria bacterium]